MEATLEATTRDTFGKNEARRTRREGRVPAVLYGGDGKEATPIAVPPKALLKILHSESGQNTLISLKLAGASDTRVLVKDFQIDPVTHEVLHADFYRIAMDRVLQVTIPVTVQGEPKGVKQQGGILEFIRREIVIECLPGRHSRARRRRRQRADAAPGHPRPRRRDQPEVEAGHRRRPDARARDHAEGRGSRGAGRRGGGGHGDAGRAGSHQEGQEGRGRGSTPRRRTTRRKEDKKK